MGTVIKIKYGDTIRRTSIYELELDSVTLRKKICKMFGLNLDADFTVTYIDEDGEVITLCDDDDLDELTAQDLNPVRMTVTLNPENNFAKSFVTLPLKYSAGSESEDGKLKTVKKDGVVNVENVDLNAPYCSESESVQTFPVSDMDVKGSEAVSVDDENPQLRKSDKFICQGPLFCECETCRILMDLDGE